MSRTSGSITFTRRRKTGGWLVVKQASIPIDQQAATLDDLAAMMAQLESGLSAHTAIDTCPLRRYLVDGVSMASYTAEIEVHHAAGIEYELEITKDGELLQVVGPEIVQVPKDQDYEVNRIQTVELGWMPVDRTLSAEWVEQAGVFNKSGDDAKPPPGIQHVDGILYIDQPVVGVIHAGGIASYDRWTVDITHRLGSEWQASLWAVAWWPAGADRSQQYSAEVEIKLPKCVEDAFSACPNPEYWPADPDQEPRRIIKINRCKPEVISITYDEQ